MRIPLALTIALLLLTTTFAAGFYALEQTARMMERDVEINAINYVRGQMTRLQGTLERGLRYEMEGPQIEISAMGSDENVALMLLGDDKDRIIAATRQEIIGQSIDTVLPEISSRTSSEMASQASGIKAAMIGKVELSEDRQSVTGMFPISLGNKPGELRPSRIGILFEKYSLTPLKMDAHRNVQHQVLVYVFFMIGLACIAWIVFHLLLTRRIDRIVSMTELFAAGELTERTGMTGADELGRLGRVFDEMAEKLQDLLQSQHSEIDERTRAEEELHIQTVELEQEVAERQMAQESLHAQAVLLKMEIEERRKAQDELENLNEKLEQRVQERTAEVQQAYDNLKTAQSKLLQQDKMASIGQLAAGVAHEINNPMGFIISNLGSLAKYAEKMTAYLDVNEQYFAGCEPAILEHLIKERKKYKIDRIRQDLPELIAESLEGAERVRKIVQDLKSFSRIDSSAGEYSDINEGLESTISIAWNELKYKATVTREYGRLPKVWCNMGQLNQVFLNLLVNAAHAIKGQGEIRITTWEEANSVRIAISDTGAGIPPENLKRIFDPFFTTKEVGKGTGLGLAIAYDIVTNKHGGSIEVKSELGNGSTFTITLPVAGKACGESEPAI